MTSSLTPQALIQQGKDALHQGDPATAMLRFRQALRLDEQNPDLWAQCGVALQRLGRYSEAMIANNNAQALYANRDAEVQPLPILFEETETPSPKFGLDDPSFWLERAGALVNAGSYELAIASYDKAIALQPDRPHIWNHRGMAFFRAGNHTEAIASFDQAIKLNPENYQSWHNRASVWAEEKQYEQAIADYDVALRLTQQQLWPAWEDRGMCIYLTQGYRAAIIALEAGLQAMQPKTADYPRACGILHQRKGDFQYREGHTLVDPYPSWQEAKLSYLSALEFLTFTQFPRLHLLALQSLLTVCNHLNDQYALQTMLPEALEKQDQILQMLTLSPEQRQSLKQELVSLEQMQIDLLAQQDVTQALLTADAAHHARLNHWRGIEEFAPVDWAKMQKLLRPQSALLFWHLSPVAISVFVLKLNQFPTVFQILPTDRWETTESLNTIQASARQRSQLEEWIQHWHEQNPSHLDPLALKVQLQKLRQILNVEQLCQEALNDVQQLILVPNQGLQSLPLHTLFTDAWTLTYLPTIHLGLELRQHRFPSQQFLMVTPQTPTALEDIGIQMLYPRATRLVETQATKARTLAALKLMSGQGWIAATAHDHAQQPLQSAIELVADQTLTLADIVHLDLRRFSLICLSSYLPAHTAQSNIGLPTALLMAGVAHVIISQWHIGPMPMTLILLNVYQRLQQQVPPALALQQAQHWLCTITYSGLGEWGHYFGIGLTEALLQEAQADPEDCPYSDPFYWAGFKVLGNSF
jgi:tetratricopeptide (TPR) repeat protein